MKVECTLVQQDWDGIIPALLAKKYDAIVASMSITEERKQKVDFTKKYYQTPARFVAKKGAGHRDPQGGARAGKKVGVQRATIHDSFLTDNFGDAVEIVRYATQDEANLDLVAGRVDLLLGELGRRQRGPAQDRRRARISSSSGRPTPTEKWFGEGVGIAVRKARHRAARQVQRGDRRDPRQRHLGQDRPEVLRLRRLRQLSDRRDAAPTAAAAGADAARRGRARVLDLKATAHTLLAGTLLTIEAALLSLVVAVVLGVARRAGEDLALRRSRGRSPGSTRR